MGKDRKSRVLYAMENETGLVEALEEFIDGELIIKKYYPKKDV